MVYTGGSNITSPSQVVPVGHTAMRLSHSYSSIKLFENCPLRYYRQRIKKEVVDEGGEASKHGERIHAFLENRLKGSGLNAEVAQYEPLCASVERLAKQGTLHIEHELVRNADQFQMQMFAAQVFKHFPDVQRVKTSLVWLKTMEMDTEQYTRVNMNAIWAEIMKRIQRIHDAYEHGNWPARPSGLCRFCPCRHDCDYARV